MRLACDGSSPFSATTTRSKANSQMTDFRIAAVPHNVRTGHKSKAVEDRTLDEARQRAAAYELIEAA